MNKKETFVRELEIQPAFDKRNPNPKKNYGIHGCEMRFVLKGALGAVQFVLYTNWQLPHVTEEFNRAPIRDALDIKVRFLPLPADLGYHSPKPMYKGQTGRKDCPYLGGKTCYYDGSGLQAEGIYTILLEQGSEGVWKALEAYYKDTFGKDKR